MDYLKDNEELIRDYKRGTRARALIAYATFPASLAALGALKAPDIPQSPLNIAIPLLIVSAAPLSVLYFLVKQRLKSWYLTSDYLSKRSKALTGAILLTSTIICLAAGVIKGDYIILWPLAWWSLPPTEQWAPLLRSTLMALISLVASSTIFLTAVKSESDLPGLPSKKFTQKLEKLKDHLRTTLASPAWKREHCTEVRSDEFAAIIKETTSSTRELLTLPDRRGEDPSLLESLLADLEHLESARRLAAEDSSDESDWSDFFDPAAGTSHLGTDEKIIRNAAQKLRGIRIDE